MRATALFCMTLFVVALSVPTAGAFSGKVAVKVVDLPDASAVAGAAAAYDSKRGVMFIFGGDDPERSKAAPGLLRFDIAGESVSKVEVSGERPNVVSKPGLVYDPKRDALLLFGGWARDAKGPAGELWTLSLGSEPLAWQRLSGSGPAPRNGCVIVIDSKRDRVLVHGGDGGRDPKMGFTPLEDLWSYDLVTGRWTRLTPTGDVPPPRWNHSGTVDADCGKLFIFGGGGYTSSGMVAENDVYELDLEKTTWRKLPPNSPRPLPVEGATLTYDPSAKALVLVGGMSLTEKGLPGTRSVWVFALDQNRWSESPNALQSMRREHTAVYDVRSKRHVIYGGQQAAVRNFYVPGGSLRNALLITVDGD